MISISQKNNLEYINTNVLDIDFRKEYASMYPLRWEIERTFSILEEILKCENIWYFLFLSSGETILSMISIINGICCEGISHYCFFVNNVRHLSDIL